MEESVRQDLKNQILEAFGAGEKDVRTFSPLALAFVGDAVYSPVFRTLETEKGNRQVNKLHLDTNEHVRASAQAKTAGIIMPLLSEEEEAVFRRGRNAAPSGHIRSATDEEYRAATGLEALCGYLYLTGRTDRLLELLKAASTKQASDTARQYR